MKGVLTLSKWNQFAKYSILAFLGMVLLAGCDKSKFIVLNPKGPVAQQELDLIIISVILCAVVIIPVLGIFVYIAVKYRDRPDNKAPYQPEWADSKFRDRMVGNSGYHRCDSWCFYCENNN